MRQVCLRDKQRFVSKDALILPQTCEQIYPRDDSKKRNDTNDRGNQNGSNGARVRD